MDLRKYPFLLQDGDIIGFRLEKENISDINDDFQTDQDLINKSEFNLNKEKKKKEVQKDQANKKKNKNDDLSLFINLQD